MVLNKVSLIRLLDENPDAWRSLVRDSDVDLLSDIDVFIKILKVNDTHSEILSLMPMSIRNNRNLVVHAINKEEENILYIGDTLKNDRKFMMYIICFVKIQYIDNIRVFYRNLPSYIKTNPYYWLKIVKKLPEFFGYLDKRFINSRHWTQKALETNYQAYPHIKESYKKWFKSYLERYEKYHDELLRRYNDMSDDDYSDDEEYLSYISSDAQKNDPNYVEKTLKNYPEGFKHASDTVKADLQLCKKAITCYKDNINYCFPESLGGTQNIERVSILNNHYKSLVYNGELSLSNIKLNLAKLAQNNMISYDIVIMINDLLLGKSIRYQDIYNELNSKYDNYYSNYYSSYNYYNKFKNWYSICQADSDAVTAIVNY